MRRNKVADFLTIKIFKGAKDWGELFEKLSRGIRADDIAGVLNEDDDHGYVLLANAGLENFEIIKDRLNNLGLEIEYIEDLEVD